MKKRTILQKKRVRRGITSLFLVMALAVTMPSSSIVTVHAETAAEKRKAEAQSRLNEQNKILDSLNKQKSQVQSQLSKKAAELSDIMAQQATLQAQIDDVTAQIGQANEDLQAAEERVNAQYEAMKQRIQFTYENSMKDSLWTAIIEAKGIADMLNRIEYATQVHNADRDMMTSYENAVAEVKETKAYLEEQQQQQQTLMASYEQKEKEVQQAVTELKAQSASAQSEINAAKKLANDYKSQVAAANEAIRKEQEDARRVLAQSSGSNGLGGSGINPGNSTNVSGQDIVNYAKQFVGSPYVWGGAHFDSLEKRANYNLKNGADCSGFVSCVFAHFGIHTPNYSLSFANGGKAVSIDSVQPGDVLVYKPGSEGIGHVAIYAGNGVIVEAQDTAHGITCNRSFERTKSRLFAIRRYN